ncbi:MAG: hypothetical protein AUG88_06115 [Actinobacteria bacterium 13_1_20CM_4_68_12]|nr:MAG: hypothetical protein AUG88_06115 [Actinobacteria bacterium 13_1_20CM_4_68_12]
MSSEEVSSEEVVSEPARAVFSRVLLKLSGESLMGDKEYGLDGERIDSVAGEIIEVQQQGVELAIVLGAGNIYRGMAAAAEGMDRATADYAGMLATLLNALALQDALERQGAHTRVLEAIERGLKVMDTTALSLCMDNHLPIHVFALADGNIRRVVDGERVGTIVSTPTSGADR